MTLWRVDVGGVAHRYVEADSREEAVEKVSVSLIEALDVRASAANNAIRGLYSKSGPIQRVKLLQALDGLTTPHDKGDLRRAEARLARLRRAAAARDEWIAGTRMEAPVSPELADLLARDVELDRVERNLRTIGYYAGSSVLHR